MERGGGCLCAYFHWVGPPCSFSVTHTHIHTHIYTHTHTHTQNIHTKHTHKQKNNTTHTTHHTHTPKTKVIHFQILLCDGKRLATASSEPVGEVHMPCLFTQNNSDSCYSHFLL